MAVNKILIGHGQSYIVGREPMNTLDASRTGRKFNLRVWDGTEFECINSSANNNQFGQSSNCYGYEFELLDLAQYLKEDLYYLKYSIGGTGAYLGAPFGSWNVADLDLTTNLKTHITNAQNWMSARNKNYSWIGEIWDQGQKDSNTLQPSLDYQVNENAILNDIDNHIGYSLKKYIFQLNDLDARTYMANVKNAKIANVAADPSNRRLIDVVGVTLGSDGVHPSKQGNELMGQRLVDAIKLDL